MRAKVIQQLAVREMSISKTPKNSLDKNSEKNEKPYSDIKPCIVQSSVFGHQNELTPHIISLFLCNCTHNFHTREYF